MVITIIAKKFKNISFRNKKTCNLANVKYQALEMFHKDYKNISPISFFLLEFFKFYNDD